MSHPAPASGYSPHLKSELCALELPAHAIVPVATCGAHLSIGHRIAHAGDDEMLPFASGGMVKV
eukprot:2479912-Rhodomonas_salina.2